MLEADKRRLASGVEALQEEVAGLRRLLSDVYMSICICMERERERERERYAASALKM